MDQVTDRRAHSDRVPPRSIDLNGWIGKIGRHHQLRIERTCFRMTHAARSGGIHQEDGPLRAAGTRRKRFVAFDDVATVNFLDARSKSDRLAGFTRLRLTTDRKSTRLNSSHSQISYAVFCLKKKKQNNKLNSSH